MRILISNDDGINAQGINVLRKALEPLGEIYVVAPDRPRSAAGLSITMHKPLRADKVSFEGSQAIGYAINGTPSDCVKLGIEALLPEKPDIVVSGINKGPNLGTDVLYSGTVSAALEAVINDVPAIAVSLASWDIEDYEYAAEFTAKLVKFVVGKGLPGETLLNVNVPPPDKIASPVAVSVTRLGKRRYQNIFEKRTDPRGKVYYWMGGEVLDLEAEPGTDIGAVNEGHISVTPLFFDVTDQDFMKTIEQWKLNSII